MSGVFVGVGRLLAQFVHAAMDVGVFGFVVADDAVDHGAGLLRGGGVVEIDQRLAVRGGVEDREIGADFCRLKFREPFEDGGGAGHSGDFAVSG